MPTSMKRQSYVDSVAQSEEQPAAGGAIGFQLPRLASRYIFIYLFSMRYSVVSSLIQ